MTFEDLTANVFRHSPKPVQGDLLHIDAGHAGDRVPHDPMDGVLVPNLVRPGAEGVPESVEADAFAPEVEFLEEFVELLVDAVYRNDFLDAIVGSPMDVIADPGTTERGDEHQISGFLVHRLGSPGDGLAQGVQCFWPQRNDALDTGLGTIELNDGPFEVYCLDG